MEGISSESDVSSSDESSVDLSSEKSSEISSSSKSKHSESGNTRGRAQRRKLRHAKGSNKVQELGVEKFAWPPQNMQHQDLTVTVQLSGSG